MEDVRWQNCHFSGVATAQETCCIVQTDHHEDLMLCLSPGVQFELHDSQMLSVVYAFFNEQLVVLLGWAIMHLNILSARSC